MRATRQHARRKANIFSFKSKVHYAHTVAPRSAVIRAAKSQNTCKDLGYFCSGEKCCFTQGFTATQFKCENVNVKQVRAIIQCLSSISLERKIRLFSTVQ